MRQFTKLAAVAVPLMRENIDTDQIIPGHKLLSVEKSGFGDGLFAQWRYLDGEALEDPEFILNQEPYRHAEILIAGVNFACGSSREPAVWALRDYGIRAVIAPSFGGIFYANCFNNGVLPVALTKAEVEALGRRVIESHGRMPITINLEELTVSMPGSDLYRFRLADVYRQALLRGLDAIDATLQFRDAIDRFTAEDSQRRPWIQRVASARLSDQQSAEQS